MVAKHGIFVDGVDDSFDKIPRVRCGEADAVDAGRLRHVAKKSREIPSGWRRIPITIYILAEQLNLGISGCCEIRSLPHYAGGRSAPFGSPGEGNDTVGAGFIATFDNGDVCSMRVVPARHGCLERGIRVETQTGHTAVSTLDLYKKF